MLAPISDFCSASRALRWASSSAFRSSSNRSRRCGSSSVLTSCSSSPPAAGGVSVVAGSPGICAQAGTVPSRQEIGRAHVELPSLMRISYAVFCLKKTTITTEHAIFLHLLDKTQHHETHAINKYKHNVITT